MGQEHAEYGGARPTLHTTRRSAAAIIGAVALAVLVVAFMRWGPDWPAQEFRAWIAVHDGLTAWTPRWYGGSELLGYSLLYPPVAAVFGAGGTGVLAVGLSAWASAGLAPQTRTRAVLHLISVAVLLAQALVIGQVPFLLGSAFGLAAFRALARGRHPLLVFALAVLCSFGSPLAGSFLVLAAPACIVGWGWRRGVVLAGGLAGSVVSMVAGGAGGPFPMPWPLFVSMLAFAGFVLAFAPKDSRALRVFALTYALAAVVLFVVPNPIGGNLTRLGKLLALPLAVRLVTVDTLRRRLRAAVIVAFAVLWPTVPFVTSIVRGATDPSQQQVFYAGMIGYLRAHVPVDSRIEIPFTREHWEAYFVAQHVPIARGWERQTDYLYNEVLYHPLTAAAYHRWLQENAVRYVALPDVPIDTGGQAEADLLRHPPAYLQPVWSNAHWRVWRVTDATSLVSGAATLAKLDTSSMQLRFAHAGLAQVRVRASDLWHVSAGRACLGQTRDGFLTVRSSRPGTVVLDAGVGTDLLSSSSCR